MSHFYRLVIFFFLLPAFSHAAVSKVYSFTFEKDGVHGPFSSASAACSALVGVLGGGGSVTYSLLDFNESNCKYEYRFTGNPSPQGPFYWALKKVLACPSGSTESGGVCSCDAGYTEIAGTCEQEQPPDPCEQLADMCSGSQGMSTTFSLPGRKTGVSFTCMSPISIGADDPLPGCTKGCMAQVGGFTTAFQDNSGSWVTTGSAKYSGATCDPSVINDLNAESDPEYVPEENPKTSDKPDPSCPGGFKGTVNGVSVCVPPKASSGVTEMESKDNGDGTKTDSKTEVKCENGKCEVTKTSTTTNTQTGSTVNSSSVTTTVDKATYCSQNKTAGACKNEKGENEDGNGSFGGSCSAGFTCKGDAVMCAMAKEQHKRNCEVLGEDKDPASFFNQVKSGTDSKSAEALKGEAKQINISTQLDMSGAGLSRSCPADPRIDLPFAGKSFVIPFSAVCPTLKTMSDVALMITALSLLVWLVNGRKEGE